MLFSNYQLFILNNLATEEQNSNTEVLSRLVTGISQISF